MKKSTRKWLTNILSILARIKEVQITEAKVQDYGDYLPLDIVFEREKNADRVLGKNNLPPLIEQTANNVRKKKFKTAGYSILGFSLIAISISAYAPASLHPNKFARLIYVIPALLACFFFYVSGKKRVDSISVSEKEILDNSNTLDVTLRDLEILNEIRDRKVVIFGKDIDGQFWEYSPEILKTENWRLFLLFGVEMKSVLFLSGWFPSKGLFILKSEYLKLQQVFVIDTQTEAERNINTSTGPILKSSKAIPVPTIDSKKLDRKKEYKKQREYKRPKILDELAKNSRFSPFLKCLLWKKSNSGKFLRKAKKAKAANDLSPARTRYLNTILYCFENWSAWKLYLKGALKGGAKKNFEEELLFHLKGLKKFKQTDSELLKKFVTADMRSLDAWIEELEIVPPEDIIKVTTDYLNSRNKSKK